MSKIDVSKIPCFGHYDRNSDMCALCTREVKLMCMKETYRRNTNEQ